MAIKIIKHKQKQKKYAYHFVCSCGCEFWSDSVSVYFTRDIERFARYETKCPECNNMVSSHEAPILRNEIFDD